MSAERRMKDKSMAAMLKDRKITRTTGACPRHCGAQVTIGGPALLAHLGKCKGAR